MAEVVIANWDDLAEREPGYAPVADFGPAIIRYEGSVRVVEEKIAAWQDAKTGTGGPRRASRRTTIPQIKDFADRLARFHALRAFRVGSKPAFFI